MSFANLHLRVGTPHQQDLALCLVRIRFWAHTSQKCAQSQDSITHLQKRKKPCAFCTKWNKEVLTFAEMKKAIPFNLLEINQLHIQPKSQPNWSQWLKMKNRFNCVETNAKCDFCLLTLLLTFCHSGWNLPFPNLTQFTFARLLARL